MNQHSHHKLQTTHIERLAHRGLTLDAPENSLAAFAAALSAGTDWLEIDVNTTRDGVPIVFHDPILDRMTDSSGLIAHKTWAEIRELTLPGGYKIPTLQETIDAFPHASFNIDMKDVASAETVPQVLASLTHLPTRVRITSFVEKNRKLAYRNLRKHGLDQVVTLGASELSMIILYLLSLVHPRLWDAYSRLGRPWLAPIDVVQVPLTRKVFGRTWKVLTPQLLKTARNNGYQVHIWTVDDPDTMRELIDLGVNGIVTNRCDVLTQIIEGCTRQ